MDEYDAVAYAAEINYQLWKEELATRQTVEAEVFTLTSQLEKVQRLVRTADQLEMHQLRELLGRIAAAVGLAARVK